MKYVIWSSWRIFSFQMQVNIVQGQLFNKTGVMHRGQDCDGSFVHPLDDLAIRYISMFDFSFFHFFLTLRCFEFSWNSSSVWAHRTTTFKPKTLQCSE